VRVTVDADPVVQNPARVRAPVRDGRSWVSRITVPLIGAVSAAVWLAIGGGDRAGAAALLILSMLGGTILAAGAGRAMLMLVLVAYLAGLQPVLRQAAPGLPYFLFEYTLLAAALGFILRQRRVPVIYIATLVYALYLMVEVAGSVAAENLTYARGVLVPSATLLAWLLVASYIRLSPVQVGYVFSAYLVGACSLGAILAEVHLTGGVSTWGTQSSFGASAGMGPVQVSFLLAVAVFFCAVFAMNSSTWRRWGFVALGTGIAFLMVLTFARGGIYIVIGSILLYSFGLRRPTVRGVVALVVTAVLALAVFDAAVDHTGGMAAKRYGEMNTSNRTTLVREGWNIFMDHPWTGVGTGNYYTVVAREEYFGLLTGAHNELVRAAAEHGFLGLVLWSLFALAAVGAAARGFRGEARALRTVLVMIFLISTAYNGLKLMAQPLLLFLAVAAFAAVRASRSPQRRVAVPGVSGPPWRGRGPGGGE
jgi:O-antigen ligase